MLRLTKPKFLHLNCFINYALLYLLVNKCLACLIELFKSGVPPFYYVNSVIENVKLQDSSRLHT